jgi:RNA-directed DNA polymerase
MLSGKGSHAVVDRLEHFLRQHNGLGWYLKLDIHNFVNTIHRPTLYSMLCKRLDKNSLNPNHALALRSLCHKLLANKETEQVRDVAAAARLPPHKRLANALPGCGLPVSNLTSQFFANVYLDALDQFVKHTLKSKHYVRYVDDFVLISKTPKQLREWHPQIEQFLANTLRLMLKDAMLMQPLCLGIDFLDYCVFVDHCLVRPRVVQYYETKLAAWATQYVKQTEQGTTVHASSTSSVHLQTMLGSYWGHFSHTHSVRLGRVFFPRFAWLKALFTLSPAGALQAQWPGAVCQIQRGYQLLEFQPQQLLTPASTDQPTSMGAVKSGWLRHCTRRREITHWFIPNTVLHASPHPTPFKI